MDINVVSPTAKSSVEPEAPQIQVIEPTTTSPTSSILSVTTPQTPTKTPTTTTSVSATTAPPATATMALTTTVAVTTPPTVGIFKTATHNLPIELQNNQNRRSSSRSIKRKRFDDEIVEYSLSFPQSRGDPNRMGRPRTISQNIPHAASAPLPTLPPATPPTAPVEVTFSPEAPAPALPTLPAVTVVPTTNLSPFTSLGGSTPSLVATPTYSTSLTMSSQTTPAVERTVSLAHSVEKRRAQRGNRRTRKSGRPPNMTTTKDLGRWKPIDDLALIIGVQQTNDLRTVLRGVKFSCKFNFHELQTRWFSLMYDPGVSRTAVAAMRNLHPEIVESVQRKALFSTQEEALLGTFKSTDNPKLEQFQELLDKNASVFYCSRTAKTLQNHWQLLKSYQLLPDQSVKPLNTDEPMTFSDAEDLIADGELNDQRDEALEIELSLADRQHKREIRLLENELSHWNVLVDTITNVGLNPEFDSQTLAFLRGSLVRYLMRSKEITFGRDAKDSAVDIDLSLEGPSSKISRRQGTIKLRSNGDFFIANEGKRPLFIDGVPLLVGTKTRLCNNCRVEICGLRFIFQVNYDLINAIRHESAKTTTPLN